MDFSLFSLYSRISLRYYSFLPFFPCLIAERIVLFLTLPFIFVTLLTATEVFILFVKEFGSNIHILYVCIDIIILTFIYLYETSFTGSIHALQS